VTTDVFTPAKRSEVMRAVKSTNTRPERAVRDMLWSNGFRYRLDARDLPGKPDIVFRGRRAAIFVHGCFWHGHDCARGARVPKANREYWQGKIARNVARDAATLIALKAQGWRALVVWECQIKDRAALNRRLTKFLG
jgi:DNA mismatch endonuclease (patch repair protein)